MISSLPQEPQYSGFPTWLQEYHGCIDDLLKVYYGKASTELERRAFEAASKGKRMRAVLALLWCEASCGNYLQAAPVAVAYELAHAAAIVQDDVIDHSELRSGERSVMGRYGISGAILISNTLLFSVPK